MTKRHTTLRRQIKSMAKTLDTTEGKIIDMIYMAGLITQEDIRMVTSGRPRIT